MSKRLWLLFLPLLACSPLVFTGIPVSTGTAPAPLPVFTLTPENENNNLPYSHFETLVPPFELTVSAEVLRVRACPSTDCLVLGYLHKGDTRRAFCRPDGWCSIGRDEPAWIWGGCAGLPGRGCE